MAGTEQEKVKKLLVDKFSALGDDLEIILIIGSIVSDDFNENSDIDLIIALRKMDFETKRDISQIIVDLERSTRRKLGVNIIKTNELIEPRDPLNSLDGKTCQGLIEIITNKNMLLYDPGCLSEKLYEPNFNEIQAHSIKNISFFKLRERKLSTHEHPEDDLTDSILDRKIRASFIVSKLLIQAENGKVINNKNEIIRTIKDLLPSQHDLVSILEDNIKFKQGGSDIDKQKLMARNDNYIEEIASYATK